MSWICHHCQHFIGHNNSVTYYTNPSNIFKSHSNITQKVDSTEFRFVSYAWSTYFSAIIFHNQNIQYNLLALIHFFRVRHISVVMWFQRSIFFCHSRCVCECVSVTLFYPLSNLTVSTHFFFSRFFVCVWHFIANFIFHAAKSPFGPLSNIE